MRRFEERWYFPRRARGTQGWPVFDADDAKSLDLPAQLLGQFGNYLIHRLNTMDDGEFAKPVPMAKRIAEQGVGMKHFERDKLRAGA